VTLRRPSTALLPLLVALGACHRDEAPRARPGTREGRAASTDAVPTGPIVVDLLDAFTRASIDTDGPVVDLGEPQAAGFIGARLSLRVPIDHGGGDDDPLDPPGFVRFRVRRASSRVASVIVDGLLVRSAALPPNGAAGVVSVPVPRDRFTRTPTEVELRFTTSRLKPGMTPRPALEVDWVHLARSEATPTVVAGLLSDVTLAGPPRRALTFHPPTALGITRVLPPGATFRAALGAESPRGSSRPPAPLVARVRVELDGEAPLDRRFEIAPNRGWTEVSLDLARFAGRPARITVHAQEGPECRLAVAAPRLEFARALAPRAAAPTHVVLVVVRGLRPDRLWPELSPRFTFVGFARLLREGSYARVTAPGPRPWAALMSATTGLPVDVHRVFEHTDLLSDEAPTLTSELAARGVAVSCFSEDPLWFGSGADRGCATRWSCADHPGACRADASLAAAADELVRSRSTQGFTLVVSRGAAFPLDPSAENVTALDPTPYEGTMTPAQTAALAERGHRGDVRLDPRDQDRLNLLYDASLRSVDQGLALLLDRIAEAHLDERVLVVVVGDRGVPLGEQRAVWEGPMAQREVNTTAMLWRGPGVPAGQLLAAALGVVDGAATALAAFDIDAPAEMEGRSVRAPDALHDRAFTVEGDARGGLGLRFGALLALPRPAALGGGLALRSVDDPAGEDLSAAQPIARALAWQSLALSSPAAGRRVFRAPTRVIAP
jgi:hypothetical protein